ncbi:response regulator [Candidatus Nitrospira nitrificans]|uniref:Response regulator, LuxR family n=1 Tax=Candidatus Nitrospira nitrificans TaxID=1742973 RepID=A0A0S4LS92_9BACT|nr:response regulator transcription factor [Candidatus Nitrospira nitrificans]CUS38774.1 Response regulator, LuxR family [Candidatus Nitrospira nitrificans]
MKKPRVLLADDHTFVLEGFKKLLEGHCELVGAVEDGRALIAAAVELQPQIVILDISMPRLNGIEAAKKLKKQSPEVKLIFVTMHAETVYVNEAFRAGASGYLLKQSAATELAQAVQSVMNGDFYVTPLITRDVVTSFLKPEQSRSATMDDLTTRQREILQLVAEGFSAKEIAHQLKISHRTVEFHKAKIMEQLHLHTTIDLVKYALAQGLVTSP